MPSPKQRNKTRRLQRLANEDIESQLLGKFKLNSNLQLARFAKNNYREDLIIEYKDHQKKSQNKIPYRKIFIWRHQSQSGIDK